MLEFLLKCKYYNKSLNAFSGYFNVDIIDIEFMYNHFLNTKEYLLDDYVELIHLSWEVDKNTFYNKEELDSFCRKQSKFRKLNFLDYDILSACRLKIKQSRNYLVKYNEYLSQKPRKYAQAFISKKNIREFIFKRDNYMCLSCGSLHKLTIDHIQSIYSGGLNRLYNLQTLCGSCNSSKSTKYIDYR